MKDFLTTNTIIYCRRWEEAIRFYRDLLGLPITFSADWFVEFRLNELSRLSIADERRSSIKSCGGMGVTISLEVDDIETVWEDLERASLGPSRIKAHQWNAKVFHVIDPEGNRIEFWQRTARDR